MNRKHLTATVLMLVTTTASQGLDQDENRLAAIIDESVETGNVDEIIQVLESNPEILRRVPNAGIALCLACLYADCGTVALILNSDPPVEYCDGFATPECVDCALLRVRYVRESEIDHEERIALEILRALHQRGVQIHRCGAIHGVFCFDGHQPSLRIVKFLCEDMGIQPMQGWSELDKAIRFCPIRMVAYNGSSEVMTYMLEYSQISGRQKRRLIVDAIRGENVEMLKYFFEMGYTAESIIADETGEEMSIKEYVRQLSNEKFEQEQSGYISPCLEYLMGTGAYDNGY